jgi:hypothetical protein
MKPRAILSALICLLAVPAGAQAPAIAGPGVPYTPEQLDQLTAPMALYPDPLVALILPASTAPSDVTLAARYVEANGDPSAVESQSWDESVKALTHYPALLKWMDDNLEWTQSLGAAFAQQPADVMRSIQQMRAKALAAGTLVNTPEQQVDIEGDDIRIEPAQENEIYLPQYDPDSVYEAAGSGTLITFGAGYPVGEWLGYECDWDDFGIWMGVWAPGWAYRRDWSDHGGHGSPWRPDPHKSREVVRDYYKPDGNVPRPRSIAGGGVAAGRPPEGAPRQYAAGGSRPDYRGRATPGAVPTAGPAPSQSAFGGYNRGTETRAASERGQASRSAPVERSSSSGRSSSPAPGNDRNRR